MLATDLDPRHLAWLPERYDNVEVRQHNAVTDDLPTDRFDLAHTRLLVAYLPERESVIAKMTASVKPGGWLIIEDFDSGSLGAAYPTEASEKFRLASIEFFKRAGYDHLTGRRLPGWLRKEGLKDVDATGSVFSLRGSKSAVITPVYLAALRQQRTRMIQACLISEEDFGMLEQRYQDPEYDHLTHTMMTVWGRRPAAGASPSLRQAAQRDLIRLRGRPRSMPIAILSITQRVQRDSYSDNTLASSSRRNRCHATSASSAQA